MSETPSAAPRPFSEVPSVGGFRVLRRLLGGGNERLDMLGPLQQLRAELGDVVVQNLGMFKMINLFGPDACQFVLMDRDGIFSARRPWTRPREGARGRGCPPGSAPGAGGPACRAAATRRRTAP